MKRPRFLSQRQFSPRVFGEPITIRRQLPGRRDSNGVWFPGGYADTPASAETEPLTLEREPGEGGVKLSERRVFRIAVENVEPLRSSAASQTGADRILYNGSEYLVSSVRGWNDGGAPGGGFIEAVADRVEGQE